VAWLSLTTHASGDTPVLATVLNNIGADIRTWGGAVDGGGNALANISSLAVYGSAGIGIATSSADFASGLKYTFARDGSSGFLFITGGQDGFSGFTFKTKTGGSTISPFSILNNGVIKLANTPVYADNAAAIAGGLTAGMQYRTSTGTRMEVY
jgi:hypothetical protein